jgi:hypothetical protein
MGKLAECAEICVEMKAMVHQNIATQADIANGA